MLEVLGHRSLLRRRYFFFLYTFAFLFSHLVAGQTLVNGQTFTNGLAIIDAPAPQNPGHAGSSISIAIDVSGDGKLPSAASLPGSGLSNSFQLLEIYLVSAETNLNMTVSAGPGLLTNESGSTVKHLNWPIPPCIPAGNYNLTFYETSFFNSLGIFAITPIPIPILNPSPSGSPCPNLNPLQGQPQSSNPLRQSPFLYPTASAQATATSASAPASSRMATVINAGPTLTLTLTLSNGVLNIPTVTVTAQPTPTTGHSRLDFHGHGHRNGPRNSHHLHSNINFNDGSHSQCASGQYRFIWFYPSQRGVASNELYPVVFIFCVWILSCAILYSRMF
ncbi:hypothetical protein B0H13DRAFT_788176 [Mycena leptocephala]|nr:hypothetical protein B0H13DRAFT_788176 [Mycena leptocephala]